MNAEWLRFLPGFIRTRLDGRHQLQRIIGNSGWLFADKFLRYAIACIVGILIARHLGPNDYGVLSYANAFLAIFTVLSMMGLDGPVIQKMVKDENDQNRIMGTAFCLKFFSACVGIAFSYLIILLLRGSQSDISHVIFIIAWSLFCQPADVVDYFFQSKTYSKPVVIGRMCAFLLTSAGRIALVLGGGTVVEFALMILLEALLSAMFLICVYRRQKQQISLWHFDWKMARDLLTLSWPIFISATAVALTMQIDKVLLGEMQSVHEVGLYAVASQLSSLWNIFPLVLGTSLAPAMTRLYAQNQPNYFMRQRQIYRLVTYVSLAIGFFISIFSDEIIELLFGSQYANAAPLLAINVWVALFVFHVSMRSRSFLIEGKQSYIAKLAIFTLAANVILNLFLIPRFGALGAACASLLAWFMCAGLFPFFWSGTRQTGYMFYKSFLWIRN